MINDIKSLFSDISLLYKNIIHWNLSKIFIFLWSIVCGFIAIIPFAFLFFVFSIFSDISFTTYFLALINGTYTGSFFGDIIYFLSLVFFVLGYFFNFILLLKLNSSYLSGEKLSYKNNEYFNYKLFIRYIGLSVLIFLIFLLPLILSLIILALVIFALGGIAEVSVMVIDNPKNIFSIISLIVFILFSIIVFYLFYRFVFSYFLLIENKNNDERLSALLKKSFIKTSGFKKFLNFLLSIIIVFSAYLPFSIIDAYINGNYEDLNTYATYFNLSDEDKETLKELSSYKYNSLELKYSGVSIEKIEDLQYKFYYFSIIFSLFKFLFVFGLFSMFLTSFYDKKIKD